MMTILMCGITQVQVLRHQILGIIGSVLQVQILRVLHWVISVMTANWISSPVMILVM